MIRTIVFLLFFSAAASCSKKYGDLQPVVIPGTINGVILDIKVTPIDISTPDKASLRISMNNVIYSVEFNAAAQSQSNATILFASDTILRDDSREFANLGKDEVAYNPVGPNEIRIRFTDGREIFGWFEANSSFGGVFGEQVINQWRTPNDPAKPNQKAKDDISNFIKFYEDKDGTGPARTPVYLFVKVSIL